MLNLNYYQHLIYYDYKQHLKDDYNKILILHNMDMFYIYWKYYK